MPFIKVEACLCNACGHVWLPRPENPSPVACAKCKSPYWNKPRVRNVDKGDVKPDRETEIDEVVLSPLKITKTDEGYHISIPSGYEQTAEVLLDQRLRVTLKLIGHGNSARDLFGEDFIADVGLSESEEMKDFRRKQINSKKEKPAKA